MKKGKKMIAAVTLLCLALMALVGCGGTKNAEPVNTDPIRIGCKPIPEQMILQEILAQLIEANTDYTVERMDATAGGTSNIQPAMVAGEMDLYPEYTGTGWLMVLKNDPMEDADAMYEQLCQQYEAQFQMKWIALYGFENTYTLAVRAETQEQYGLETISDLAAVSDQLVFGANFDYFEREDGYNALCEEYGLHFRDTAEVDQGLKYQTLAEKNCDVINAYTTDSQIADFGMVTLADDHKFFTDYRCATVVRAEVLEAYPGLEDALMLMENLISNEDMVQMNYQLNTEHRLEAEIAKDFLTEKGLLHE